MDIEDKPTGLPYDSLNFVIQPNLVQSITHVCWATRFCSAKRCGAFMKSFS